jgi:hypothetical protein
VAPNFPRAYHVVIDMPVDRGSAHGVLGLNRAIRSPGHQRMSDLAKTRMIANRAHPRHVPLWVENVRLSKDFCPVITPVGPRSSSELRLREPVFDPQAHRGVVEMIRLAGLGHLPIQPALLPARVAGIARFRSVVKRIEQKVEEIVDEGREVFEHLLVSFSAAGRANISRKSAFLGSPATSSRGSTFGG